VGGILIYDPSVPAGGAEVGAVPLPRSLRGLTIGVIDNTKPNFDRLAAEFTGVLRERHQVGEVVIRRKRSPTVPAPAEVYDELAARCHLVFCGSGD